MTGSGQGNAHEERSAASLLRWLAGWVESFLWRVEYHASQWADALNRRFT